MTYKLLRKTPNLAEVLNYRNERVVGHFLKTFAISEAEARSIFKETLKWLWLCGVHRNEALPGNLSIYPSMLVIDEMWHSFLICTADYRDFCSTWFGEFIDHRPDLGSDPVSSDSVDLQRTIELVVDRLGEETAIRWFREFRESYPRNRLRELKR